jgi:hypothetical protein
MERGPLNLVSTIEGLLARKSSGSGLEAREFGRRDPSPRGTLDLQMLALTAPTSGGRIVGIIRSRTQATEFNFILSLTNFARMWTSYNIRLKIEDVWRLHIEKNIRDNNLDQVQGGQKFIMRRIAVYIRHKVTAKRMMKIMGESIILRLFLFIGLLLIALPLLLFWISGNSIYK